MMLTDSLGSQNKPVTLNTISSITLNIIRSKQTTTFSEVADLVIKNCTGNIETGNEKTTRRRVYDVLNVFLAAGLIKKEAKNINYVQNSETQNNQPISEEDSQLANQCEQLRESVINKLKAYLLYRSLLERNYNKSRPTESVQLPAIFVEFPTDKGVSELSLDQKTLEITADQHPTFYSPVDILSSINLSIESQRELVRSTPLLARFEPFLFPDPPHFQPVQEIHVIPKIIVPKAKGKGQRKSKKVDQSAVNIRVAV